MALAALIAFSCYQYSNNLFKHIFTIMASISSLLILFFMLAAQFNDSRTTINIRTTSILAMFVNLLLLFLFSGSDSTLAAFVISLCFLIVIYLGVVYSIVQKCNS